jgi:hypothetical protein
MCPLQACDLIAWELGKVYTDAKGNTRRIRESMKALLRNVVSDWKIVTEENLAAIAALTTRGARS